MHVIGIKKEVVDKYPWAAVNLYRAFEESKAVAMERMENPRIAPIVWYREAWEEQEEIFHSDPWEYGLTDRNRHNLDTLVGYSFEQGLSSARFLSMSCSWMCRRDAGAVTNLRSSDDAAYHRGRSKT